MLIDIKKRLENIDLDIRTITAEQAVSEQKNNGGTLIDVREAAEVSKEPDQVYLL